jgi:hypothetical protein
MKKLTFKNKFYIFITLFGILALMADIFNIIELNRYNSLMFILLLTIIFCGIQYSAAKKGLDVMLSISKDYYVRQLWNIENQFDWEKVRKNQIKWAPICVGISLVQGFILYLTGEKYAIALMIIWALNIFSYLVLIRPLKYKSATI